MTLAPPPGLVLAGGRSRRFGREKALAEIAGAPMIARVVEVLARACASVAVSASDGSGAAAYARSRGLTLVSDRQGDPGGPLAGVRAGLAWAQGQGADWLITAPCDTPFLPSDYVARLMAANGPAFAESPEGAHWLCALWPATALAALDRRFAQGAHGAVREALAELGARPVRFDEASAFANVNRPEDLA